MSDYDVLAPKARKTQDGSPGLGTEVGIGATSHAASLHDSFVITTLTPYFTERRTRYGTTPDYRPFLSLLLQNFSDA